MALYDIIWQSVGWLFLTYWLLVPFFYVHYFRQKMNKKREKHNREFKSEGFKWNADRARDYARQIYAPAMWWAITWGPYELRELIVRLMVRPEIRADEFKAAQRIVEQYRAQEKAKEELQRKEIERELG